jgi:hypothetical protein
MNSNNNLFYSNYIKGADIAETFEDENSYGNTFDGSQTSFAEINRN